ncbi:MAG TPA: hypothetical protein VF514_09045 [Bacteroidota bacterium]
MDPKLTTEEESYLKDLLSNQSRGIRPLDISANLLLLAGGFLIVGTALYVARQMTDTAVYSVGLPNFIGGMLLIAGSIFLSRRVAHMKKLTSILFKLSSNRIAV